MQELVYNWVCCSRTLCERIVFMFVTEKEHNFQKNENIVLLHFILTLTSSLWSIVSIV